VFDGDEKIIEFLANGEIFKASSIYDKEYQESRECHKEYFSKTKSHTMPKGVVNLEKLIKLKINSKYYQT